MRTKTNYLIHTDAIKQHIIPKKNYSKQKQWFTYAEEAGLLNVALFGCTSKDWREVNKKHANKGLNIRDFASINEWVVLSNLENINSVLIENGIEKELRFGELNRIGKSQLKTLNGLDLIKSLKRESETTFIEARKKK